MARTVFQVNAARVFVLVGGTKPARPRSSPGGVAALLLWRTAHTTIPRGDAAGLLCAAAGRVGRVGGSRSCCSRGCCCVLGIPRMVAAQVSPARPIQGVLRERAYARVFVCMYTCHPEKVKKCAYSMHLFCILCACFASLLRFCIFLSLAHRYAHMHCLGLYPSVCA